MNIISILIKSENKISRNEEKNIYILKFSTKTKKTGHNYHNTVDFSFYDVPYKLDLSNLKQIMIKLKRDDMLSNLQNIFNNIIFTEIS